MKWFSIFLLLAAGAPFAGAPPQAMKPLFPATFIAGPDPFTVVGRKPETFSPLPFGSVRPEGWLLDQVRENLDGFTGHLDSLAPNLIIKDDIFGRDRLTKNVTRKDLGVLHGGDTATEVQYLWWNSETQGNWRDGWIRSAILTGDPVLLNRVKDYVRRILATQDPDGYLGIYDKDLRYHFDGENGELWSKTTLLRGLLAWYDYSRDPNVLEAVERAVKDVMNNYPINASHPFYSRTPNVGGLSHGLMFSDILESLYRLTGRSAYLDYAVFLYKDFSAATINEDAQYSKIIDPTYRLRGHGVHTYEHLRAVAAAAYASGNPALQTALDDYLQKISREITPSGAPAGDEWIGARAGDATNTGYEYCSLEELMNGYTDLIGKTGLAGFGDSAERLFFNAAQGARDPQASCIAYLKTDNSYYMTGGRNVDSSNARQTRYKYSPVHQDVAVCCVPNAGRIAPYFIDRMWMRSSTGLVATLLGPCKVATTWKGTNIRIEEDTKYPNDYSFDFNFDADRPVTFTLAIRKPSWATRDFVSYDHSEKDGYILITRTWRPGERVVVRYYPEPVTHRDRDSAAYFTYGPLVLAHSIAATAEITKRYPLPGFFDYHYRPKDDLIIYDYKGGGIEHSRGLSFEVTVYDPSLKRNQHLYLEPMDSTILRQVTFGPPS